MSSRPAPAHRSQPSAREGTRFPERIPWSYFLAFLLGTGLVVAGMWYHIEHERRNTLAYWGGQMATLAEDRARLVENWLGARRADAGVLAASAPTRARLTERDGSERALVKHLNRVTAAYGYAGIFVFNDRGRLLARSDGSVEPPIAARHAIQVAQTWREHVDLVEEAPGRWALALSVPAFAEAGRPMVDGGVGPLLGVVTLWMKPEAELFPLLTEPTGGARTAETLLFRLDGSQPAYLSPFRQAPRDPSAVRRSIEALRSHVNASARHPDAFGEVLDYRGRATFATTRWVAPTGWGLVAKVDRGEALSEFHRASRFAGAAAAFLLMALAALLISRWRHKQRSHLLRATLEQEQAMSDLKGYAEQIATSSERLQAERQASEERFRDLVQGLDAIVWEADAATLRFSFASQRAERILGWPVARWLADPEFFAARIHPEDRERAMATCRDAIARGVDHEFEYRALTADGGEVWLRDIVHVLPDADGRAKQLRGLTVDLTLDKRAEDALRQTEEQLRQAQKMDAVGKLAGGIAHDFNNLLMVIRGDSDLILRQLSADHPLRANAEGIRDAADQAATLTRQLLAFSRKQVLAPRVLDINRVVAELQKMLERLIGEPIEIVTATAPDLGPVRADPGQIEQMLLNLVVNARDAMPDGGRLTITTANAELGAADAAQRGVAPGAYVMVAVTDTGFGMDDEMKGHLFEPFFTTKEQGKGTGLGLSTVYGIVNQSGGHIRVESQPGEGTTFRVFLPRVAAPEPAAASARAGASEPAHAGSPAALPARRETILLVEDAARVRAVVREILDAQGYEVIEARRGVEALEQSAEHAGPIHLMVTDVVMPEMSGRELAQRLAALRPEMKVLYMSGYTDDAIVRHGVLDAGMAFISKPFTPDALSDKVRELLGAGVAAGRP